MFEAQFRAAITRASSTFDVAPIEVALDRWWDIAAVRGNPLTEQERALLDQARAGDFAGLHTRDERGTWSEL